MAKKRKTARKPRSKFRLGKKTNGVLLNLVKFAGVASLVYGVIFGVLQYVEAKKEKRIEQTLTLFRQFNNAPYTEYRKNINIVVIGSSRDIFDAASDEAKLATTIANVVRNGKIETDLLLVMDFFDGVVYCAAKNICDAEISYDLFHSRARELYIPFYQYIQTQRGSFAGNDFGAGVETLVKLKKTAASGGPAK